MVKVFSLKNTIIKLMSTKTNTELSCIEGMRVLTMFYIIVGHVIELADVGLYSNYISILFKFT